MQNSGTVTGTAVDCKPSVTRVSVSLLSDDFLTLVITAIAANPMCKLELAAVVTA